MKYSFLLFISFILLNILTTLFWTESFHVLRHASFANELDLWRTFGFPSISPSEYRHGIIASLTSQFGNAFITRVFFQKTRNSHDADRSILGQMKTTSLFSMVYSMYILNKKIFKLLAFDYPLQFLHFRFL